MMHDLYEKSFFFLILKISENKVKRFLFFLIVNDLLFVTLVLAVRLFKPLWAKTLGRCKQVKDFNTGKLTCFLFLVNEEVSL